MFLKDFFQHRFQKGKRQAIIYPAVRPYSSIFKYLRQVIAADKISRFVFKPFVIALPIEFFIPVVKAAVPEIFIDYEPVFAAAPLLRAIVQISLGISDDGY